MEDDSLPENQKISEKNSFLENIMNRNTRIQRYDKRLNTFTSSRAASISSSTQKGAGLIFSIANRSAIAVNAFSAPDKSIIF